MTSETKETVSGYSWISLLGAAITIICTFVGFGVAGYFATNNDEALLIGIVWGALAGLALGGIVVGAILGTVGERQGSALLLSPGVFVGVAVGVGGVLNGEVIGTASALAWILGVSAGGTVVGHWAASRTLRTREP